MKQSLQRIKIFTQFNIYKYYLKKLKVEKLNSKINIFNLSFWKEKNDTLSLSIVIKW